MNFISCCHRCRKKVFHYRRRENETMIPFYRRHGQCMRENPDNLETREDQLQEEDWMVEHGYENEWKYDEKMRRYIME